MQTVKSLMSRTDKFPNLPSTYTSIRNHRKQFEKFTGKQFRLLSRLTPPAYMHRAIVQNCTGAKKHVENEKKKQESRSQETRKQEEHEMKGAKAVRTKAGVNR